MGKTAAARFLLPVTEETGDPPPPFFPSKGQKNAGESITRGLAIPHACTGHPFF
jgi:hypothetical protein